MSVLIKGMEMPKNCINCPCYDLFNHICQVTENFYYGYCDDVEAYRTEDGLYRIKDCPLVEVPTPHGRLIDADEIGEISADPYEERAFQSAIEEMPTIVEAEG